MQTYCDNPDLAFRFVLLIIKIVPIKKNNRKVQLQALGRVLTKEYCRICIINNKIVSFLKNIYQNYKEQKNDFRNLSTKKAQRKFVELL